MWDYTGMKLLVTLSDPIHALLKRYSFRDLEEFYNPNMVFDTVHLLALFDTENYDYEREELGSLVIHPLGSDHPIAKAKSTLHRATRVIRYIVRGVIEGVRIVRKCDIDVIRSKNVHEVGLIATLISKITNRPCVQSIHNDFETKLFLTRNSFVRCVKHLLETYNLRNATSVIGISRYLVEYATRRGATLASYIPNPVDTRRFLNTEDRQVLVQAKEKLGVVGKKVLLNVGRYGSKQKNVKRLLVAYSRIRDNLRKSSVLLILGDGEGKEQEYRSFVGKLGIDENVKFVGVIPHKEVPTLYRLADIFVFPTLFEGFGYALVEALAVGMPILTSNHPVPMEYVDETNGVIVNPYDTDDIRRGIEFLMNSSEKERKKMRKVSRMRALEYGKEIAFEKEAELYLSLMQT